MEPESSFPYSQGVVLQLGGLGEALTNPPREKQNVLK